MKERLDNVVVNVWFLFFCPLVNREIKDCCCMKAAVCCGPGARNASFLLNSKLKVCKKREKRRKKKKRVSSPYFFIKLHPFISSAASNSQLDTNRVTFVFLQQFAVELHHLLVFFELQHALAEVEGQRETHFLQRVPVLAPRIHLVSTEDRGQRWVGGGRL